VDRIESDLELKNI